MLAGRPAAKEISKQLVNHDDDEIEDDRVATCFGRISDRYATSFVDDEDTRPPVVTAALLAAKVKWSTAREVSSVLDMLGIDNALTELYYVKREYASSIPDGFHKA